MTYISEFPRAGSAKKAIVFARVSSREQEQGYSIEAQKHRLEIYCSRHNLEVIKTFEITESSTRGDRDKFMEMICYVKTQKETVAIVADKVDRVQRSFKEHPLLDALIQEGKIELHFNTENYFIHKDSRSHEVMMWSMSIMMAKNYVDSSRDNIKRAIDQKIRMGEYPSSAPIGYLNSKDVNGRSNIILDPERALLVRRLFEEYATGAFTIGEMAEKAKAWGLRNKNKTKSPLVRSYLHYILNNPFYYGHMKVKGNILPHRYEPLVSKQLWDSCQAVMKAWDKRPFQWAGKEFVFRGLLTCKTTGKVVSALQKKKTYLNGGTGEWTYLRAWNPQQPEKMIYVREDKVLAQIEDALGKLAIPEDVEAIIVKQIRETDGVEREFGLRQREELKKEQDRLQGRLDSLMDLLLDKAIDQGEYERKRQTLRGRQTEVTRQLNEQRGADEGFKDAILYLLNLCRKQHDFFSGSTVEQKRQIVNHTFENLTLDGETLCYSYKKPFSWFVDCEEKEKWWALYDTLRTLPDFRESIITFANVQKSERNPCY